MAPKKISKLKNKTLSPKVKRIVLSYIKLLKKDDTPLKRVIVFGSQAKGTARHWSDIDICLISPKFTDQLKAMSYLLQKASILQAIIEPHPFHPKDFVNEDPLVWEIKQNGIELPL